MHANGSVAKLTGYAEQCMAEYDLDGWKVPDLTDPGEMSYHVLRNAQEAAPRPTGGGGEGGKGGVGRRHPGGFRNPYANS
jgi:hypothetical protein